MTCTYKVSFTFTKSKHGRFNEVVSVIYLLDWHSESIAYDVNKLLSVTLFLNLLEYTGLPRSRLLLLHPWIFSFPYALQECMATPVSIP